MPKHRIHNSTIIYWSASMANPIVSSLPVTKLGGEEGESQVFCWMELNSLLSVLGQAHHGMIGPGG